MEVNLKLLIHKFLILNYQLFDAKFISKGSSIIKKFFKEQSNAHLINSGSSSGTVGFIPLNLNLTIDGMSGIKKLPTDKS